MVRLRSCTLLDRYSRTGPCCPCNDQPDFVIGLGWPCQSNSYNHKKILFSKRVHSLGAQRVSGFTVTARRLRRWWNFSVRVYWVKTHPVPSVAPCQRRGMSSERFPRPADEEINLKVFSKMFFFFGPAWNIICMTNPAHSGKRERKTVSDFYWLKTPPTPSFSPWCQLHGISFERFSTLADSWPDIGLLPCCWLQLSLL